jgi:hypothetical protein
MLETPMANIREDELTGSNVLLLNVEHGIVQGSAHQELEGEIWPD